MDDDALISLAAALALEAGAAILAVRQRGFDVVRKEDRSPVTEADHAAEAIIVAGLRAAAPDIPVIAEEEVAAGRITEPTAEYWLVDPLDGTREFAAGNDEFAVNIGLVRNGRPVLGVVAIPAAGELFGGIVGRGAWKRVGSHADRGQRAVAAGRRADGAGQPLSRQQHAARRFPARQARGEADQFRFEREVLPAGGGDRRSVSALRPHHGVGHLRATGGAGGSRRHGADVRGRGAALRQAGLGESALRLHGTLADSALLIALYAVAWLLSQ